jgi:tRNA(adenine34) deaminase
MANYEHYMRIALDEAERAAAEGNTAVGSVLVRGERIVACGRNLVTSTSDPTAHAETVALRLAGKQLGYADFSNSTLYTTFEPCPMCCGAILTSGVETLVIGARYVLAQSRWGAYTVEKLLELTNRTDQLIVITGILSQACADVRKLETT